MKMIGLLLLTLGFIFIATILFIGTYRTWKTQTSPNQALFISGSAPMALPNGFYSGKVTGLKTNWQGKKFNSKSKTGINIFKKEGKQIELYPFKIYMAAGLQDNIEVLRIDYNLPENPLWVRFVKDEIVETGEDKFLGKIHLTVIPGLPVSVGYFSLF
ncbi:MAG: hypothetical protein G01um10147_804 [Microgenomates group bacterium Gr01-1014_7]|nr:MAG: hypothetical protein G01um10147_804 [Microgenomates group bacterium Gr01-1014_7]